MAAKNFFQMSKWTNWEYKEINKKKVSHETNTINPDTYQRERITH